MNGVSSVNNATTTTYASATSNSTTAAATKDKAAYGRDSAAVYEPSKAAKTGKSNKAIVAQLKADQEARLNQMQSLVKDMFLKQGTKITNTNDMWKMLASGNFTVDPETAKEAKDAISENGYWGVEQTSQRIFDFAHALSGGDKKKMEEMLEAVKKGFGQATKSWGRNLPDISNRTYDAVLEKFEAYQNQDSTTAME